MILPENLNLRPETAEALIDTQNALHRAQPLPWTGGPDPLVAGCFVASPRWKQGAGTAGDPAWAAAVAMKTQRVLDTNTVRGRAGAPYTPGLLFLREGPALASAIEGLNERPEVLIVNGTGLDHPRRAGLALHLGALLELPTVGVTHRPLLSEGVHPQGERGQTSPLMLDGELVGYWLRTKDGLRPLAVHAGWLTSPETAVGVAVSTTDKYRTPEPLRLARQLARSLRSSDGP